MIEEDYNEDVYWCFYPHIYDTLQTQTSNQTEE